MPQAVCRAGAVHSKFAGLAPAFFGFHRRHALNAPDKLAQFLQLTREPLPASSKRYLTGSRADIRVPLPWGFDPVPFNDAVRARIAVDPRVFKTPAPVVETVEHTHTGSVTAVRPCCAALDYGEVFLMTQRVIGEELRRLGVPAPPLR